VHPSTFEMLLSYDWPGNVRELKNTISRMVSFLEGDTLMPDDIPERVRLPIAKAELDIREDLGFKDAKEQWVASFEKQYLAEILKRNNFNISAAAKEAGIDRKSVQRLVRKYNLNAGGTIEDMEEESQS
jgi:DNA-binding NtrC family response regulator